MSEDPRREDDEPRDESKTERPPEQGYKDLEPDEKESDMVKGGTRPQI